MEEGGAEILPQVVQHVFCMAACLWRMEKQQEEHQNEEGYDIEEGVHLLVAQEYLCAADAQVVVEGEENPKQTEQEEAVGKSPRRNEQIRKKRVKTATKKIESTKVVRTKTANVPQLEEIAKNAISFDHFVKLVAKWLEIEKKPKFFENLVMAAIEVENMSWKELENVLKNKGITYTQWDKILIGKQMSEKFNVTILPFLNAMRQYKEYSFGEEKPEEKVETEQRTEETFTQVEVITQKSRVKMECMPEIIHFEETLGSVDKTQPIEERVNHVLRAMGCEKMNVQEQKEIFEIANTAVRMRPMHFDIIFSKVNIPIESPLKARLTFSKFINDFVIEYDSNKKVKLLDFLKQLQEIVMNESEIESYSPCSNSTL